MSYKLGKLPARKNATTFKLSAYLAKSQLPMPGKNFGHYGLVSNYGMLGNDNYGDCVWAGAGHETEMWNAEANKIVNFDDKSVLSDYSAVTGFKADDPNTDQGTDMEVAAKYRRTMGVIDSTGTRHKILAYLALTKGNLNEHLAAVYLFGAVGVGINFPSTAMPQFDKGLPWTPVKGAKIEGGHYVPLVGRQGNYLLVCTWGKIQRMSTSFFKQYNDESLCYLTSEDLIAGNTPEGFNSDALVKDLSQLKSVK